MLLLWRCLHCSVPPFPWKPATPPPHTHTYPPPISKQPTRFVPTCSQYSIDSYKQFGVWRGTVLTAWRLMRCNPWSECGGVGCGGGDGCWWLLRAVLLTPLGVLVLDEPLNQHPPSRTHAPPNPTNRQQRRLRPHCLAARRTGPPVWVGVQRSGGRGGGADHLCALHTRTAVRVGLFE